MLFNVTFWCREEYLPTKRHKRLRERYVNGTIEVEVKELTEQEFPVAFIVKDYDSWYEKENEDPEYEMHSTEIRTYNSKLWKAIRYNECVHQAPGWMPLSYLTRKIEDREPYCKGGGEFSESSIIKVTNIGECKENIRKRANNYVIFDGKVWQQCEEPMYMINTFGLGHNHGGTGFFIQYHYNPNISKNNYFNALEREKAIEYGKKVAANRGDTKSIEGMGDYDIIEVIMPEMVKRNPQKEHGDGDPFINSLENMINSTSSSSEAGILAMMMTMNEIKEN